MVFPNFQRPTGSRTTWNIAPGRRTELTKSYKIRAAISLRSVDRTCSIAKEVPIYCRTVAEIDRQYPKGHVRIAGHRSVVRKRIYRTGTEIFDAYSTAKLQRSASTVPPGDITCYTRASLPRTTHQIVDTAKLSGIGD
jgi:hypothetical protein